MTLWSFTKSFGDRATDDFIEVHICGTFDLNAVESVRGISRLKSRDDRDLLRITKRHLREDIWRRFSLGYPASASLSENEVRLLDSRIEEQEFLLAA